MAGSAPQTPALGIEPILKSPATDAQQHCWQANDNTTATDAMHSMMSSCAGQALVLTKQQ